MEARLAWITRHLQHQDDDDKLDALGALLAIVVRCTSTERFPIYSTPSLLTALIANAQVDKQAMLNPHAHRLSYECRWRSVMLLALLCNEQLEARNNSKLIQVLTDNVHEEAFASYAITALGEMFIEPELQLIGMLCTYLARDMEGESNNNPARRALKLVYNKYTNNKQRTSIQLYTFWRAAQSVWSVLVVRTQKLCPLRRLPIDMFKLTFKMLNGG